MRSKVVMALVLSTFVVSSSFAVGSLEWYTPGNGQDVLYTADGLPGVGTESLSGISGASSWYTMVYDASLFDVTTYDMSNYASAELARDDLMAAELYGGAHITIDSPTSIYIYEAFTTVAGVTPFSEKSLGTVVFNTDNPNASDLSGMMFAYSTTLIEPALPDLINGSDTEVYETSSLGFDGSEWVAVPEPATALFGLVGIVTLAIARRRRQ